MERQHIYLNTSELTSQMPNDSRNIRYPLWNLDYFVLSVLISILSLVGLLGNIPVLIVYVRRKDRKASNTFIKFLAFLDLLVCSTIMPYSVVYEFHLVTSDVMCRTFEVLRHFIIMASNVTLVAIAIERYIAVCQIGTKISFRNIKKGVWAIVIVSLLIALPAIGTFAVVNETEVEDIKCNFPHETTPGRFCHFTYTIMGENLVFIYQVVQMAIFCLILLVIVVLYTVIYVVLWKKTQIRRQLTRRHMSVVSSCPDTFLSELAEKCGTRNPSLKPILPADESFSPIQSNVPLKLAIDENSDNNDNDELSSTELEPCKSETKVKFHHHIDNDMKLKKDDVTVTSDSNGGNVKSTSCSGRTRNLSTSSFGSGDKRRKKRYYHRRTAKMLFLCTVIYFVTWLPFWMDIFGLTNSLTLRYLFFIGNASNPIVYGIVNEQVRKAIKNLFVSFCGKPCCPAKNVEETDNTLNCSSSVSQ